MKRALNSLAAEPNSGKCDVESVCVEIRDKVDVLVAWAGASVVQAQLLVAVKLVVEAHPKSVKWQFLESHEVTEEKEEKLKK